MCAHGCLDALCDSALRKQLRTETSRCREPNHIPVHFIRCLPQGVKEHRILPCRRADNALPERRNRTLKRNDILLHKCTRKLIVRRDLICDRRKQLLIEDSWCSDDEFPCVFLCRDLNVAQRTRTQCRPLLIGEGEPAQEAEKHILCTGKNPIGLVHSS